MIIGVKFDDDFIINQIQDKFNDIYKQKNELKNEYNINPYTKVYAYIEDEEVLGFIHINTIYDRYEINNICVLSEYRKTKIASKLMDEIINLAEKNNINNISLEVRKDNVPAINLYKKYGFLEKAVRKGYYKGIDGILMEKEMM